MKKISITKVLYILFIIVSLVASAYSLKWLYECCAEYEANSAETLINKAIDEVKKEVDLELTCNKVPSIDEEGFVNYKITNDNKVIANIQLEKIKNTVADLAIFKLKEITPINSYKLILTEDINLNDINGCLDKYEECQDLRFFESLTNSMRNFPKFKQVNANNLYDICQLISVNKDYEFVSLKNNTYFILQKADNQESIIDRTKYLITKYSSFMSGELSKEEMLSYILSYTPLARVLELYRPLYTYHSSTSIENLMISDAYKLNDDFSLINAQYDFKTVISGEESSDKTMLSIILYKNMIVDISNYFYFDLPLY